VTAASTTWVTYVDELEGLRATVCVEDSWNANGDNAFHPVTAPPPRPVLDAARRLPRTPAILWDLDSLRERVNGLRGIVREHGLGLSAAVKACRNHRVLSLLAKEGLTADVASLAEWDAARRAGFDTISATGPGFRPQEAARLLHEGVLFDAQSLTQLDQLLALGVRDGFGLRLRVPLPDALRSTTSRGGNSRFGVEVDSGLLERLEAARVRVGRLRVHTGESTARTLEFRARYAFVVAALLGTVTEVNLGGGFLRLARDPAALRKALGAVTGGPDRCWIEPGAALVADSAYLVMEVLDEHPGGEHAGVTVDASAWNIAPWTYPSFYRVGGEPTRYQGNVYGPTLYEKDRFRNESTVDTGGGETRVRVGDRLVGTSFGAYTIVNGRRFAGLALPAQFAIARDELECIDD